MVRKSLVDAIMCCHLVVVTIPVDAVVVTFTNKVVLVRPNTIRNTEEAGAV